MAESSKIKIIGALTPSVRCKEKTNSTLTIYVIFLQAKDDNKATITNLRNMRDHWRTMYQKKEAELKEHWRSTVEKKQNEDPQLNMILAVSMHPSSHCVRGPIA